MVGKVIPGKSGRSGIASTPAQKFDAVQARRARKSQYREKDQAYAEKVGKQETKAAEGKKVKQISFSREIEAPRAADYSQDRVGSGGRYHHGSYDDPKQAAAKKDAIKTAKSKVRAAQDAQSKERDYRAGIRFKDPKNRPTMDGKE